MFLSLDLFLEYSIEHMLPSVSFMSNLYSQLGYFTEEFQAMQLIVLMVFGTLG